jgi:two-component system KDP operon response regulator KdpE
VTAPGGAPTVLVVEDEPEIRGILRRVLEELGVRVTEAATGAEGIALAERLRPDLVVLDLGLPDVQGDEVCRAVRASPVVGHVPIVVVSARHSEEEKVRLLDAGADDYLTKPFGSAELAARVRAHLRRAQRVDAAAAPSPALRLGDLALDLVNRTATRGATPVHLTPIEWGLLKALSAVPGRTLTHQQLFEAVWRREYGNATQYLRVHVTNLRRKVEPNPSLPVYIVTEPGVGYRLELPS